MSPSQTGNRLHVRRARSPVRGVVHFSGDKSVSIRRALISLWTERDIILENYGSGQDCQTALRCLGALGKHIVKHEDGYLISGAANLNGVALHCQNSGTTARLLMGLLAAREDSIYLFFGDESLSRRPMERVAGPLRAMGADCRLNQGCLPAELHGTTLHAINLDSTVASAQIKSAVLLAGACAEGVTKYREPFLSRDHTERLLKLKANEEGWIECNPEKIDRAQIQLTGFVPGDISSAAFWGIAAAMIPESDVRFEKVLTNPLRTEWLRKIEQAGAETEMKDTHMCCDEEMSTVMVRHRQLRGFSIEPGDVPKLVDELPVLAVAAAVAEGESQFHGLTELRVKESDRFKLIFENLENMGAKIAVTGDSMRITGKSKLSGAHIKTNGDHRIAMAFAIAGLAAEGETVIDDADCIAISYPEFQTHLNMFTNSIQQ